MGVYHSAESAFCLAARVQICATERDCETTRRGRGDMERVRVSRIRRSNVAFGRSGKNCTVTPGGGPVASTDDAVSWISSSCDGGSGVVAEPEPCSDGVVLEA